MGTPSLPGDFAAAAASFFLDAQKEVKEAPGGKRRSAFSRYVACPLDPHFTGAAHAGAWQSTQRRGWTSIGVHSITAAAEFPEACQGYSSWLKARLCLWRGSSAAQKDGGNRNGSVGPAKPGAEMEPQQRQSLNPTAAEGGPNAKPNEVGLRWRGGARERTQFSPPGGNGVERTLRRRRAQWPGGNLDQPLRFCAPEILYWLTVGHPP